MAKMLPFNIHIPAITKSTVAGLAEVSSPDIFEGATKVLHPQGLFSVENFGRIGEEKRSEQIGYININVKIFHPLVYDRLKRLKALYSGIIDGTRYALWDDELKDFVPASEMEGQTGAAFFMSHWKNIVFQRNKSPTRTRRINVVEKYRDQALSNYVLVLPAGMRDIESKDDGRVEEDEINSLYRKLITLSRTVTSTNLAENSPVLDATRHALQTTFNEIYDHIFMLMTGKNGFLEGKFASRRLFYGTRNVLSAMDTAPQVLGEPNTPSLNDTVVGLFQTMRGMLPVTVSRLLRYTEGKFNRQSGNAVLYDRKTLKKVNVSLDSDELDRFTTAEGLDKFINKFKVKQLRHAPVNVKNYYLGLIYVDDQNNFMHVDDIDALPEGLDRKWVRPITHAELFYLCNYRNWSDAMLLITRFPITGEGSIYPSSPYVKTTMRSEVRYQLDSITGERIGEGYIANEYPDRSVEDFMESMSPHTARLDGLGGDFDGDTGSADFCFTDDAMQEKKDFFATRKAYISTSGRLRTPLGVNVFKLFLHNFTHERKDL